MKTLLFTLTSLWLTLSAHAQGTVNFANNASTAISNIVTGARVPAGNSFLAQLYYGPAGMSDDRSFNSVTNAPVGFTLAGQILAGTRYTTLPGGTTGSFQIRVWESALGGDWDTAVANWLTGGPYATRVFGKSGIIQVVVADPFATPPQTPTSLVASGFKGFYLIPPDPIIPEPSTLALGALGMAALLWRRRRTS